MRILLFLFLFTCFRTDAQEVNIVLTDLKNEEKIDYLSFQGESYFDVSDTIRVILKDEYVKLGLLVIKLKNGYILSDFSAFYGLTNTENEPIEFNVYKRGSISWLSIYDERN